MANLPRSCASRSDPALFPPSSVRLAMTPSPCAHADRTTPPPGPSSSDRTPGPHGFRLKEKKNWLRMPPASSVCEGGRRPRPVALVSLGFGEAVLRVRSGPRLKPGPEKTEGRSNREKCDPTGVMGPGDTGPTTCYVSQAHAIPSPPRPGAGGASRRPEARPIVCGFSAKAKGLGVPPYALHDLKFGPDGP